MDRTNSFKVKIFIKTQAKKNEFLGYDNEKGAYTFRIKAPAFEGKANKELLRFLKKEFKVNCKILQGETSHFKVLLVQKNKKAISLFVPKSSNP